MTFLQKFDSLKDSKYKKLAKEKFAGKQFRKIFKFEKALPMAAKKFQFT